MVSKGVVSGLGNVIIFIIIIIIGFVLIVKFTKAQAEKDKEEAKEEKFRKRGFLASLGDFLLGEKEEGERTEHDVEVDKEQAEALRLAQSELDDLQSEALVKQEKDISALKDAISAKEVFDRGKEKDIGIFTLQKPITSKTGDIITDFAFFRTKAQTAQERQRRADSAKRAVIASGLSLGKDKFGRDLTPIHTLTSEQSRIDRFKKQLEASQRRRLGLR